MVAHPIGPRYAERVQFAVQSVSAAGFVVAVLLVHPYYRDDLSAAAIWLFIGQVLIAMTLQGARFLRRPSNNSESAAAAEWVLLWMVLLAHVGLIIALGASHLFIIEWMGAM